MTLFREDWLILKEAVKRRLFHLDPRFKGFTYEEAQPTIEVIINQMTIPEFERFILHYGLDKTNKIPA